MQNRRRIRIVLIFLGLCPLGAIVLFAILHTEPSFEGRYLSDWIWTMNGSEPGPEKEKARAVVRRLGTNSIPLLLDWLQLEDRPSLTGRFDNLRHGVFFWLVRHQLIANQPIKSLRDFNPSHSAMAMWALPELDHAGRLTVIPTLIQMLGKKSRLPDDVPPVACRAAIVLPKMAPESTAPLIEALSSHDPQVSALATGALWTIGPDARSAIPALLKHLSDTNPKLRIGAAGALDHIGADPDAFLPVLIQSVTEVDPTDIAFPLEILVRYKDRARAAVPILTAILDKTPSSSNPTNRIVRDHVINALRQIDPEALAKAGIE